MTCLTVSNNIHATSAPTGTDDDMRGNDKADALAGTNLGPHGNSRRSAQLLFKPGRPVLAFYDISGPGMHLRGTRKTRGVAAQRHPFRAPDKITGVDQFAIRREADIIASRNNYCSF